MGYNCPEQPHLGPTSMHPLCSLAWEHYIASALFCAWLVWWAGLLSVLMHMVWLPGLNLVCGCCLMAVSVLVTAWPVVPIFSWFFLWSSLHPLLSQSLKKSRGLGRCMGLVSSTFLKCCNFFFFITGTFLGVIGSSTGTFLAFLKPVQICSCIKMWLHGKGCLASPWRPKTQHSYEPPTVFSGNLDVVANSGLLSFYTSDQKTLCSNMDKIPPSMFLSQQGGARHLIHW